MNLPPPRRGSSLPLLSARLTTRRRPSEATRRGCPAPLPGAMDGIEGLLVRDFGMRRAAGQGEAYGWCQLPPRRRICRRMVQPRQIHIDPILRPPLRQPRPRARVPSALSSARSRWMPGRGPSRRPHLL
ncbi:hypothetical protein PVAP13_2KG390000 [Panicum virgatum]|uniref:Uncharacterized protein n=1 Tax=Panicum virgatum TaxID=38727 RepID=A0A8T0WJX8_PANVG|nr:hypothetical protein PVAP13_2KG390000 [Panicum virgatum]